MNDIDPEREFREPEGLLETLTANSRPQPAIPAMIVLLLTIMLPVMSFDAAATEASWTQWLIPLGLLASCGLAIAAGFCSFFPHVVWILVAAWAMKFTVSGPLPGYNRYVLIMGIVAAAIMLAVQVWRVRTRRFVPTIRIETDTDADE
jgi:hypothetical protein